MYQLHPIQLGNAVTTHQQLRLQLAREFPEADEETLADTLEGISDLPEMIAAIVRSSLADRDMAAALKSRIAEMSERLSRLTQSADRKKQIASQTMRTAGLKKIAEPDLTLSLRPVPPAVVIIDENQIPQDYWRDQPAKLDRRELRDVLLSGLDVPGTELKAQDDTLAVRTK